MPDFLIRAAVQGDKRAEQWERIREEAERHFADPGAGPLVIDIVGFGMYDTRRIVRVTFSEPAPDA